VSLEEKRDMKDFENDLIYYPNPDPVKEPRFILKSKGFKSKIALDTDTAGYYSSVSYDDLLGCEGITDTFLRPSGNIIINGKKYDAITEGEFINKGVKIKVILVEGNKIVIKEAK